MSSLRIIAIVIAAVAGLALLRFQPWRRTESPAPVPGQSAAGRERLTVGFLPVT
jgi:hypothetical protein